MNRLSPSRLLRWSILPSALALIGMQPALSVPPGMPAPDDPLYQMRDPFRRLTTAVPDAVPKSEIELIPLEEFQLVGVSTGPRSPRALVRAGQGKSWFVGLNDLMGTNGGVIRKILPDRIVVAQKVVDEVGQEQQISTEIALPKAR